MPDVVARLVGLQAQASAAPFVGLWTRIDALERDEVASLVEARRIVKATLMRGTLHLVVADDYPWLRGTLQPVLTHALASVAKNRGGVPDVDPGILRYAVRTHLPLVQVPTSTAWCYPGNPTWTTAEQWLGGDATASPDPRELVRRYLAAFGPGSVADVRTWSYLPGLDEIVASMRDELVVSRDDHGLLLSHGERGRFVATEHRKAVFLPGLRVAATLLLDGVVAGTWPVARRGKAQATLTVAPFTRLPRATRGTVVDEAGALVRFTAPDAREHAVEVAT